MSPTVLLIGFAAELVLFVAAAGGVAALVLLGRPRLDRMAAALGLAALGAAAFVRGADLVAADEPLVGVLRGAGSVLLLALVWRPGPAPVMAVAPWLGGSAALGLAAGWVAAARGQAWLGIALMALGGTDALRAQSAAVAGDVLQVVGAFLLAVAMARVAGRTVASRFVLVAAALLALVTISLSVVLSVLVTNRLTDEALDRAAVQAQAELEQLTDQRTRAQRGANYTTNFLASEGVADRIVNGDAAITEAVLNEAVTDLGSDVGFAAMVRNRDGRVELLDARRLVAGDPAPRVVEAELSASDRLALAAAPVTESAIRRQAASGFLALGDVIFVVAAAPHDTPAERAASPFTARLVAVSGVRVDRGLLELLEGGDLSRITYLVTPTGVLRSRDEAAPLPDDLLRAARDDVVLGGRSLRQEADGRYAAAVPVVDESGLTIGALVVTTPGDAVVATRRTIFRALFATALGGVLLAVIVAALAGSRITAPLRVLTAAAGRLRAGDLSTRSSVRTGDEVGDLGVAFDEMASGLEEQAVALRAAAQEETRLRRQVEGVIMSMIDGVIAIDLAGTVTAANRAAEELTGVPVAGMIGQSVSDIVVGHTADGGSFSPRLAAAGPVWTERGTLERSRGTLSVEVSRATITDDDGAPTGGVIVLRDVSEEEALERMKRDFLANISHELRTPLTPIKGYSSLMARREMPREQQLQFLDEIQRSAGRLERIIGMLVDFAAIEAGRFRTARISVDVGMLLEGVVARWDGRSPDHEIETSLPSAIPPLLGDAEVLSRALLELIDNGVKYSPDGGKVVISAAAKNGSVRIEVSDEGIGFPAEQLEELMQEFTQADPTSTRRFGGLGLGLPFVQRIVEAHGGRLSATSAPGEGSTFALELPAAEERA